MGQVGVKPGRYHLDSVPVGWVTPEDAKPKPAPSEAQVAALRRPSRLGEAKYGTKDVERLLGVPMRRIADWVERKALRPSFPPYGQGSRMFFKHQELVQILVLEHLTRSGLSVEEAGKVVARMDWADYFIKLGSPKREGEPVGILIREHGEPMLVNDLQLHQVVNGHAAVTYIHLPALVETVRKAAQGWQADNRA